jgi:hypothetical protein
MTDAELVAQEVVEREDRLDKKIYHITAKGREDLHQWLASPRPLTDFREPFLIQLFFGGQLSDEELLKVLKARVAELEAQKEEFFSRYAAFKGSTPQGDGRRAYFLSISTMEYGINDGLAELDWLKRMIRRVEAKQYDLQEFDE